MARFLQVALATSIILANTPAISADDKMTALRICADPGNMPLSNTKGEGFQNKIAELIAESLGTQVTYFYRPYLERGLTRQTFKNNSCDVLMGMSPDNERMITTTPLYRSTFVLASRADRNYNFQNLDDPRLKELSVGVFQHSAMRTELMEHGVSGEEANIKLHVISHNADLVPSRQPTRQIQDVVDGKLDVAAAWGPLAGWYNTDKVNGGKPLALLPMNTVDTVLPMEFNLALGLKKQDTKLKEKIEVVLHEQRDNIKQILVDYGVPLVECSSCIVSGDIKSHGAYKTQEHIVAKFQPTKQSDVKSLPKAIDVALAGGSSLDSELLNAVLAKDFTRVDYLVERGADINARDAVNLTPLMNAVKGGSYELVRALLAHGADIDDVDADGWSAVMHAAWQNEPKMIRTMGAGYGADLDLIEKLSQNTALGLAVQKGKALAVVALLDSGANPDLAMGKAGYTPLMVAAKLGQLPAAQVLLQYGAKVDATNSGGVTALMIAAANNQPGLFSLILKSGADLKRENKQGQTAYDLAKLRKSTDVLGIFTKLNIKTARASKP
ncbi:MAG: quinoprotein dehydrogenase-associated putative ABC transporter substrate-binding protein [Gammaproteobacteria bacterium]|nr:quinoprotein dehydrogenase-associated putative ABC transporter substrate-binding protein [Gammaproteobacteria bacterium]